MAKWTFQRMLPAMQPLRLGFMLCILAFALSMVPVAASAAQTVDSSKQLFCSHQASGVKYINTFTPNGKDQSKVVDAAGMINAIVGKIGSMQGWQKTFNAIRDNSKFSGAVFGAMFLYVVIFGIMMVFGMINLTWYEVFIRMLKLAAVYYLIFGTGMSMIVAKFIMGGMNELIDAYYDATIGSYPLTLTPPTSNIELTVKPLMFLIAPMEKVMNLQFICAGLALMIAGPAGAGLAVFLFMGLFSFFMSLIGALATYIKAVIGLTILFSIAPIFIACLLFEQTRRLFDGWLSMCLSFALQPVFIFAFLGFFMVMLDGALKPLTQIHWCYGPVLDLSYIKISFYFPVPAEYFGNPPVVSKELLVWTKPGVAGATKMDSVKLDDRYGVTVKDLWKAAGVDIYVVDVLMFCLLAQLCWRYSEYTAQIAREITGGGVNITVGGQQLMQKMEEAKLTPGGIASSAASGLKNVGGEVGKAYENFTSGAAKEDMGAALRTAAKDIERKD